MGAKGDRASKEPLAMRLYVDGSNLTEISRQLDISDTTLRRWKDDSRVPGDDIDGWDKARQQKRSNIQRLKDLFERELACVEASGAGTISSVSMDALSKLGALVARWDAVERAELNSQQALEEIDRPKIFLEDMTFVAQVLNEIDPEGFKVFAINFDVIVQKFKEKHAQTT